MLTRRLKSRPPGPFPARQFKQNLTVLSLADALIITVTLVSPCNNRRRRKKSHMNYKRLASRSTQISSPPSIINGRRIDPGSCSGEEKVRQRPKVLRLVCNWRVIAVIAVSIVESRIFTSVPAEERSNFHAPQVIRRIATTFLITADNARVECSRRARGHHEINNSCPEHDPWEMCILGNRHKNEGNFLSRRVAEYPVSSGLSKKRRARGDVTRTPPPRIRTCQTRYNKEVYF